MRPDSRLAFARYRAVDHRLPRPARGYPPVSQRLDDLRPLIERFDGFILDAFGVLNVGDRVIPAAPARVAQIRAAGKRVAVLTNGASQPGAQALEKYRGWGFDFDPSEVIASRALAARAMAAHPVTAAGGTWAAIAPPGAGLDDLPGRVRALDAGLLNDADGFVFLGAEGWTPERQAALAGALRTRPRPVLCANPDIVAPREAGFTWEPGHFACALPGPVDFHGKPFGGAFRAALASLDLPAERVVMVGDSLHTDVLGGRAAGCATALVAAHGFFAGLDPAPFIAASGIVPDFIARAT